MRLLLIIFFGLGATACSLSFNPDLPSAKEGSGDGVTDGNTGDGDIDIGDGDAPPGVDLPDPENEGMGGANQTCLATGGAGGSPPECEGKP